MQAFASTTLSANRTSIVTLARAGAGSMTLAFNAITRNTGSLLNFSATPDTSTIIATTSNSNDPSGILGPWATVNSGTNLQYATVNGSNQLVAYTTATPATTGTLANAGNTITLNGLIDAGSGALTVSGAGNLVIGANKDLVMFLTQGDTISCPIVDNPAGPSALTLNTVGTVVHLSGANIYGGGTTITGTTGELSLDNSTVLGTGPVTAIGGYQMYGTATFPNSMTFSGVRLRNGLAFNGPVTLAGGIFTGWSYDGTSTIFNGPVSGPGGIYQEGGTVTLAAVNTYSGTTVVNNGGTLIVKMPVSLYNADTSKWTPANLTLNSTSSNSCILRLPVGGPVDFTPAQVGTLFSNLTTGINNNGMKAYSTLYLDPANSWSPVNISANITDSTGTGGGQINLTKYTSSGSTALQLSGNNTYTGKTTVYGTLIVSSLNNIASPVASSSLGRPTNATNGTITFGDGGGGGGTCALVYTGTGETTDRVINFGAQGQSITFDQSGSGNLKFTTSTHCKPARSTPATPVCRKSPSRPPAPTPTPSALPASPLAATSTTCRSPVRPGPRKN